MVNESFENRLGNATKWSTITEIMAKVVAPISSMVLARLLVPEVYGVVTSVNMVISFSDIFTDAGFQKYIIQHQFISKKELDKATNVAFWTNLLLSLLIWLVIYVFSDPISALVGNPGMGNVISIACISLPLTSFSSIQNARFKRDMDFKTLFSVRMVAIAIPFVITIPLALFTRSYWALIVGTISTNLANAVVLTVRSQWKPRFYFDFITLRKMLSFSLWSMVESVLVWLTNWGDTFIVGLYLSSHYLGLYKTSMNMVNQIVSVISASTVTVLLSALSSLQSDNDKFRKTYYDFSFFTGILLIPMGVGLYLYRDTMCMILLGSDWLEAADFMGIWGLISAIAILFNSYNGDVLIAKGRPKISVIIQIIQIVVIIPSVYLSMKVNFTCLSYTRALVRVVGMVLFVITVWKMFGISFAKIMRKNIPVIIATLIMSVVGYCFTSIEKGILFEMFSILICVFVYFSVLCLFPSIRRDLLPLIAQRIRKKR